MIHFQNTQIIIFFAIHQDIFFGLFLLDDYIFKNIMINQTWNLSTGTQLAKY